MAPISAEPRSDAWSAVAPLIDAHAHFYHTDTARRDWKDLNDARLRAGDAIGLTYHVASTLGTWGLTSPAYLPSPADVTLGNDAMLSIHEAERMRVRVLVTVNPNFTEHALAEIERCVALGAIGVKLLASRRADDPLLDPIANAAAEQGLPILHHVWHRRTAGWPNKETSDGIDLARLARRHPTVPFILAHLGGGGDYMHTLAAIVDCPNIYPDLSGSGVDGGMLEAAVSIVGADRLLWACDLTMCTGLAKLRALGRLGLSAEGMENIRWRNAQRIFPSGAFPRCGDQDLPHELGEVAT
jgi:uncharacterized protein